MGRRARRPAARRSRRIIRVTGVQRQLVGDRRRSDHRVVGPGRGLAARASPRCCDTPKRARRGCIERERIEVGLSLLKMGLTAPRSRSSRATNGPNDSSASVIAVITGSGGSSEASVKRGSKMTVEVSSTPRTGRAAALTSSGRSARRYRGAPPSDPGGAGGASAPAALPPANRAAPAGGAQPPACLRS